MNKPHKHAEVIKQWADGAEIEYKSCLTDSWKTVERPSFYEDEQYRVKPQPLERWVTFYPTKHRSEQIGGYYTSEGEALGRVGIKGRIIHMREVVE
jgi:hypothetical protein